ncbi:hypothetical protein GCM10022395_04570 [Snuella lapsa]|uniref:Transposase n=1 Tax=Snuella lapsa TaxID=870481 RepID=A0ABP6WVM2_9FLAO
MLAEKIPHKLMYRNKKIDNADGAISSLYLLMYMSSSIERINKVTDSTMPFKHILSQLKCSFLKL